MPKRLASLTLRVTLGRQSGAVQLEESFALAQPGTEYVISRYRGRATNLRTTFEKIIRRAGATPWPRLFHNLRASRQTELTEFFPSHVVCRWLGNSQAVADRHYLQTVESHYNVAATQATAAVQNPVQHTAARACIETQTPFSQLAAVDSNAIGCNDLRVFAATGVNREMGLRGFELSQKTRRKATSQAERSIFVAESSLNDLDLTISIEARPELPESIRDQILVLVRPADSR